MKRRFSLLCVPLVLCVALGLSAFQCEGPAPDPAPDPVETGPVRGADVSWLTQMEHDGCRFFAADGTEMECLALLRTLGVEAVRLRVWVDPEGGWCGKEDVVAKARRAVGLGLKVMIDFHYSDFWADPGKQNKPAAWAHLTLPELGDAVAAHTKDVLLALKRAGVVPTWIQIGNETTGGMLWPTGQNYTDTGFRNYAALHNAGYLAAKEVFPDACVLVHIDKGQDRSQSDWFFGNCAKSGLRYDLIGLSLYPEKDDWQQCLRQVIENVNHLYDAYGKESMICEAGMSWTDGATCKAFLSGLLSACNGEMEGHCHGVFYWEPEGYEKWSHYPKAAFDNDGKPTSALYAFMDGSH